MTEIIFYIRFWLSLFFPLLCGFVFLKALMGKNIVDAPPLLVTALSFLLGVGILPISMLIGGWMGMDFKTSSIIISTTCFTIFLVWCLKIFKINLNLDLDERHAASDLPKDTVLYWCVRVFFILFAIPILIMTFAKTFFIPFMEFDTLATAGFQAKAFFYSRSLALHPYLPQASYPMQIPFLLTWMSVNLGSWDTILMKIYFPLDLFSGCVVYYYVIKKFLGKTVGLLGIILLLSCPYLCFHATTPYRDIFLMNYICIAFILLFFWHCEDNKGMVFLSAVFAGLATFTKSEGLLYASIYCFSFLVLALRRGNIKKDLPLFLYVGVPIGFLVSLYISYKFQRGILLNEKGSIQFSLEKLNAVPHIIMRFTEDLFLKPTWGFSIYCFFFSVLINIKKIVRGSPGSFFVSVLAAFVISVFLISVFGTRQEVVQGLLSHAGLSRILLHFFPLTVFSIIFLNFNIKRGKFSDKMS